MSSSNSTAEYRPIQGFPDYLIGNDGSVWSRRIIGSGKRTGPWRQLKPKVLPKTGHLYVCLLGGKYRYIHRLVLEAFVGPCPEGMECRHFPDRDPTNNRIENLRWGTRKENVADAAKDGTLHVGERNRSAKLTANKVREIRTDYAATRSLCRLARKYQMNPKSIWMIVTRRTWKHVV